MSGDNLQINLQNKSNASIVRKFLEFKIRDQFVNFADDPYQKPLTVSILKVINKLFLFLSIFGCLWYGLLYSYLNLELYISAVFFLIFVLVLLALGYLTITKKIGIDSLIILFVLMLLSSSFWFIRIGL